LSQADSRSVSQVPACPAKGTVQYNKSVPDKVAFPLTQVDVCYDASAIRITFTAHNETNFFVNPNHKTNDPLFQYTAMETFIARSTNDPKTYLEFEVSPANVTWQVRFCPLPSWSELIDLNTLQQAFIYNPSKVCSILHAASTKTYFSSLQGSRRRRALRHILHHRADL
jgi:hypothetical protein